MEYYRQHDVDFRGRIERLNYFSTDDEGRQVGKFRH